MARIFSIILLVSFLGGFGVSLKAYSGGNMNSDSGRDSLETIAKQAFENATKGKITKYRIANRTENDREWSFFIVGVAEYERPGFHWVVVVEKRSKQARVISGE